MAEALGRRGHDVHVVTYHLGDAVRATNVTVHRIAGPASYTRAAPGPTFTKLVWLDPLLALKLRSVLAGAHFDLIHAHHYEGMLCGLLARRGHAPPLVFDVHTLLESELPSYSVVGRALIKRIGRALDRRLPAQADHVIAVSEDMRQELERLGKVSRSKISVISNGVEADHFYSDAADPVDKVIVYAGNLAPYQGIELLLRAFARVRQDEPAHRWGLQPDAPVGREARHRLEHRGAGGRFRILTFGVARRDGARQSTSGMQRSAAKALQLHGKWAACGVVRSVGGIAGA
jgi:glycosyltransferase involved in cell wall biosynthesis